MTQSATSRSLGDAAQHTIFFDNQVVTPNAAYTYDAIYRLTQATGREHIGQTAAASVDWDDSDRIAIPLPTDGQAMRNYTETYTYDAVGNIQSLAHSATNGSWTRTYAYDEPTTPPTNNQLTSTTVGSTTSHYIYDAHGNIVSMPHLSVMQWDWKDQLRVTASQFVNDGTPETTYYQYDATGDRVRKVTDNQGGTLSSQRIYLGNYELYREYRPTSAVALERETLHFTDSTARVCLLETTTVDSSDPAAATLCTLTRYQLANHLGSATLELDQNAAIISYEEYHPYGSTSFQAGRSAAEVSLKRYRYTGKERDPENALYYHGARYYAPWLGRWLSCEPQPIQLQTDAPQSTYGAFALNPVRYRDPDGRSPQTPPTGVWARLKTNVVLNLIKLALGVPEPPSSPGDEDVVPKSYEATDDPDQENVEKAQAEGTVEAEKPPTAGGPPTPPQPDPTPDPLGPAPKPTESLVEEPPAGAGAGGAGLGRLLAGASIVMTAVSVIRGVGAILAAPPGQRPGVIGQQSGTILAGILGAMAGAALVAGAVATAPVTVAVGVSLAAGAVVGWAASKVGGAVGWAIGRLWNSPKVQAPIIDLPAGDPGGETVTHVERVEAPPSLPTRLMQMRGSSSAVHRTTVKPELSITRTFSPD